MISDSLYLLAADLMLIVHVLYVAFVVFGLLFILLGGKLGWGWVRSPWLRYLHLLAIGIVVVQSWLGITCPLTAWEISWRTRAGTEAYAGSFIAHWLNELLYYNAPKWVFIVVYSVFGGIVLSSWYFVRPRKFD